MVGRGLDGALNASLAGDPDLISKALLRDSEASLGCKWEQEASVVS